jgi:hypothetical protein
MTTHSHDVTRIQAEVRRRGITRVVHFTQSRNLAQILQFPEGIKSSASLRQHDADVFNANDPQRLDKHPDHISCSLEYPNYWMLRTMKLREKFYEDWAILLIVPDVLWQAGTLFAPRNAAAAGGRLLAGGSSGFSQMFAQSVTGAYGKAWTRPSTMLDCVPTDDQAEIMVHRAIPLAQITGVAVPSVEKAQLEIERLAAIGSSPGVRWFAAPDLFSQRLSALIRAGTRPREVEHTPVTPAATAHDVD